MSDPLQPSHPQSDPSAPAMQEEPLSWIISQAPAPTEVTEPAVGVSAPLGAGKAKAKHKKAPASHRSVAAHIDTATMAGKIRELIFLSSRIDLHGGSDLVIFTVSRGGSKTAISFDGMLIAAARIVFNGDDLALRQWVQNTINLIDTEYQEAAARLSAIKTDGKPLRVMRSGLSRLVQRRLWGFILTRLLELESV